MKMLSDFPKVVELDSNPANLCSNWDIDITELCKRGIHSAWGGRTGTTNCHKNFASKLVPEGRTRMPV
jgi:hypothetical protein